MFKPWKDLWQKCKVRLCTSGPADSGNFTVYCPSVFIVVTTRSRERRIIFEFLRGK